MAALCGIYYGVRTPLKFDSTSTSTRVFSFQALKWTTTRLRFTFPHFPPLSAVRNAGGARCSPLACSRRTQQGEDGLSTSGNPEEITQGPETYVSSIRTVALWVCMAVIFGVGVGFKDGVGKASEFFAGYLLEQSLSVDNLFVFVLIFKYFQVPTMYQGRVLSYGIAGAIIFRLSLILLGTATLQRFEAVNLLFAAILLFSSFKLFAADEDETDLSNNFVVKTCQKFIPVTANYDGNLFVTIQDGVWKESNILGRPLLYSLQ